MKHYTAEDWTDFARQVTAPRRKAEMQRHLDAGCKRCRKTLETWLALLGFAQREASYQVPASALRTLEAYYALYKPPKPLPRATALARLIFDNLLQAAPAGVRSAGAAARQLLFTSGRFLLDMRLESHPGRSRVSLIGQLLDSRRPENGIKDIPITLLRGEQSVAQTATNEFGEFHLEFDFDEKLLVSVEGPEGVFVVPLPDRRRGVKRMGLLR